jgi:hypothetical protein
MPDVVSNDELNALAAEYVLGTLDYEERKGASALLEVDPTFRGIVRIWERRFGDLHLMVEAVEPDPQVWARIKPKMAAVEQIAPAIPSSKAEEPAAAATPPAPATTPAPAGTAEEPKAETVVPEATLPAAPETPSAESKPAEAEPAEAKPAEAKPADAKPEEAKPEEDKPAESTPPAVAEAELKLAELAALLPVTGEQGQDGTPPTAPTAPAEPLPEDGLHTHAPDLVPRGFVPPAPMSTRGAPTVVEVPVEKKGVRGWMAATLMMALVAVALAGLISAWRFFPERLPAQLRANAVLNLTTSVAKPTPKARAKLAPFDE